MHGGNGAGDAHNTSTQENFKTYGAGVERETNAPLLTPARQAWRGTAGTRIPVVVVHEGICPSTSSRRSRHFALPTYDSTGDYLRSLSIVGRLMACVTVPTPSHLHIRVSERATAVSDTENGRVCLTECEGDGVTTLSSQVTST